MVRTLRRVEAGVDVAQRRAGCAASRRRPSAARATAPPRRRSARAACGRRRRRRSRPPSFSASLRSVRPARSAGRRRRGCRSGSRRRRTNSSDARVDGDLVGARHLVGEQRRAGAQARARQQQADGAARRRQHQRFDQQLLEHAARVRRRAPRGSRAPCAAPSARANSRLPTLAHAISSTSATAASSITSDVRTSPTISSCSGTTVAPQPAFACGYSCSSRAEISVHLRLRLLQARRPDLQPRDHLSRCGCRAPPAPCRCRRSAPTSSRLRDAPGRTREAARASRRRWCRPRRRASASGRPHPARRPSVSSRNRR